MQVRLDLLLKLLLDITTVPITTEDKPNFSYMNEEASSYYARNQLHTDNPHQSIAESRSQSQAYSSTHYRERDPHQQAGNGSNRDRHDKKYDRYYKPRSERDPRQDRDREREHYDRRTFEQRKQYEPKKLSQSVQNTRDYGTNNNHNQRYDSERYPKTQTTTVYPDNPQRSEQSNPFLEPRGPLEHLTVNLLLFLIAYAIVNTQQPSRPILRQNVQDSEYKSDDRKFPENILPPIKTGVSQQLTPLASQTRPEFDSLNTRSHSQDYGQAESAPYQQARSRRNTERDSSHYRDRGREDHHRVRSFEPRAQTRADSQVNSRERSAYSQQTRSYGGRDLRLNDLRYEGQGNKNNHSFPARSYQPMTERDPGQDRDRERHRKSFEHEKSYNPNKFRRYDHKRMYQNTQPQYRDRRARDDRDRDLRVNDFQHSTSWSYKPGPEHNIGKDKEDDKKRFAAGKNYETKPFAQSTQLMRDNESRDFSKQSSHPKGYYQTMTTGISADTSPDFEPTHHLIHSTLPTPTGFYGNRSPSPKEEQVLLPEIQIAHIPKAPDSDQDIKTASNNIRDEVHSNSEAIQPIPEQNLQDSNNIENEYHRPTAPNTSKAFFSVQLPCEQDMKAFTKMSACKGDQKKRISKLSDLVRSNENLTITTTYQSDLLKDWGSLFQFISKKDMAALQIFDAINAEDPIKKALIATHSTTYIKQIISVCIKPREKVDWKNTDTHLNNLSFQAMMQDIATTIENFSHYSVIFSLGLPTHHASSTAAAGFCFLNKVAILIHYFQQPNILICGLDVNADDGLWEILNENPPPFSKIGHLDSFDPRVYPCTYLEKGVQGNYDYRPFYLNVFIREEQGIHPILEKMLIQIEETCMNNPGTAIYLVLGWDSHYKEDAYCSRYIQLDQINGRKMNEKEAKTCRFNTEDFEHFYKQLRRIVQEHEVPFLYIGLEGGYTDAVNSEQVQLLNHHFGANVSVKNNPGFPEVDMRWGQQQRLFKPDKQNKLFLEEPENPSVNQYNL